MREGGCGGGGGGKGPTVCAPTHHEDCRKGQVGSGQPLLSTGKGDRVPSPDGTADWAGDCLAGEAENRIPL